MIFNLASDLADVLDAIPRPHPRHHLLTLINEAVRRDLHFIDRNPTALFQCLWNSCWWYDCPDVATHGASEPAARPIAMPASRSGPALADLMQIWESQRDSHARRPWIRSLRPPKTPLGAKVSVLSTSARHAAFAANTQRLVSTDRDNGLINIWNLRVGVLVESSQPHQGGIVALAMSRDGKRLATAGADQTVRFWSVEPLREQMMMQTSDVWTALAFSTDGAHLYAGAVNGTYAVFDAVRGQIQERISFGNGKVQASCVAVAPTGCHYAAGFSDRTVRVFDVQRRKQLFASRPLTDYVQSVAFNPERPVLAIGGSMQDSRIALIRFDESGILDSQYISDYGDMVVSLSFSPDGRWLAAGGGAEWGFHNDNTIRIWDAESLQQIYRADGHSMQVGHVAFAGDSGSLLSVGTSTDETIRIWKLTGPTATAGPVLHDTPITGIQIAPGGRTIATNAARDDSIFLWDAANLRLVHQLRGHRAIIQSFAFSPDGERLITGSGESGRNRDGDDYSVRIWSVATGQCECTFRCHAAMVNFVGFLNADIAFSAGIDRRLQFYDSPSHRPLNTIHLSDQMVEAVRVSPNGQYLLTVGRQADLNYSLALWDWQTGRLVHRLDGFEMSPDEIGFGADGTVIFARYGSADVQRSTLVWESLSGQQIPDFPTDDLPPRPLAAGDRLLHFVDKERVFGSGQPASASWSLYCADQLVANWPVRPSMSVVDATNQHWLAADGNYLLAVQVEGMSHGGQ